MRLAQTDDDAQADVTFLYKENKSSYKIGNRLVTCRVELLQKYLDEYLKEYPEQELDYVHSEAAASILQKMEEAVQ